MRYCQHRLLRHKRWVIYHHRELEVIVYYDFTLFENDFLAFLITHNLPKHQSPDLIIDKP